MFVMSNVTSSEIGARNLFNDCHGGSVIPPGIQNVVYSVESPRAVHYYVVSWQVMYSSKSSYLSNILMCKKYFSGIL